MAIEKLTKYCGKKTGENTEVPEEMLTEGKKQRLEKFQS